MDGTQEETAAEPDSQMIAEMRALWSTPAFEQAAEAVRRIAGYDVPATHQEVFLRFHAFISAPQPAYITIWRASEKLERWYHRHVNGVLGDVRGALAAAHYHKENLARLERTLLSELFVTGIRDQLGGIGIGFGGTRKLDFEYQGFVLACRRSLDYLSVALAAYFKMEAGSFRKLPKSIKAGEPSLVREAIIEAHRTTHYRSRLHHGRRSAIRPKLHRTL